MSTLAAKLKHEIEELLPTTIYFVVVLHFAAFIQALMNRHNGLSLPTSASITLGALVMGKSVLLADVLPFINRYPTEPLIWNVSWTATVYFSAANHAMFAEITWSHFWAIQLLLALLILVYCVMSELIRVIGRAEMKALFFGPLPERQP